MDGDGQKQPRNHSDKISRDREERLVQQDPHLSIKASSSIPTIQGCMEGDLSQDRHEGSSTEVKMVDGKDIE